MHTIWQILTESYDRYYKKGDEYLCVYWVMIGGKMETKNTWRPCMKPNIGLTYDSNLIVRRKVNIRYVKQKE